MSANARFRRVITSAAASRRQSESRRSSCQTISRQYAPRYPPASIAPTKAGRSITPSPGTIRSATCRGSPAGQSERWTPNTRHAAARNRRHRSGSRQTWNTSSISPKFGRFTSSISRNPASSVQMNVSLFVTIAVSGSNIIRINPEVIVRSASYSGKLLDYPVRRGICKLLRGVEYRSHDPLVQNIVVRWVRGLPKRRDECWFLMTNLTAGPAALSRLYGARMTIEELFRDHKNKRNGWSLRDTKITRPERLDRLLLILAIAYLLLCGIGLIALATRQVAEWSASPRNDCSVFTIGRILLSRIAITAAQALAAVICSTEQVAPNWG